MTFLIPNFHSQMDPVFARSEKFQKFATSTVGQVIIWILLKLYTILGMGFCLAPLALLSFSRWWIVYKSIWFYGIFLWCAWPAYKPVVQSLLGPYKKVERKTQ